ncbi:secreted nuclease [Tritrichomonas foetus]|uniref:Secreted nuclease n=1 Tax=Tritrichomonas foetus TaxID=1144522 RepID=A0A1J4K2M1_9EUKA|nr:secreted nuclease [Tritrichomonas foetus]|eukprot:OHT03982.1 secreted nuclease [Tritrichomonas foetus]
MFFLSLILWRINLLNSRPRLQETTKERLKRLYKDHIVRSYDKARTEMYNEVDCDNNQLQLIYSGTTYSWTCHGTKKPSATEINAEHIVPQSTFNSKTPMVSDLHHLLPASSKLNNMRSNYNFTEVEYDDCAQFCRDMSCSKDRPSDPDQYSCLTSDRKWMPMKQDRGRVARSILYFYTMYDEYPITVGDVALFKKWNKEYLPGAWEIERNERLNISQGNRNPYIDDPSLVDEAFP